MSLLTRIATRAGEAGGSFLRELSKARGLEDKAAPKDPISTFIDPFHTFTGLGYREHHLGTFDILRKTRDQLPPVGAILETRVKQLVPFTTRAKTKYDTGFRIKLRDQKENLGAGAQKNIEYLTRFIEQTGVPGDGHRRDSFTSFSSKVYNDRKLLAQYAAEIVPDKTGKPAAFYAVDGSTIRLANTHSEYKNSEEEKREEDIVRYVQVVDGVIRTRYRHDQLMFGIDNPTSDINYMGYGVSPLEKSMRVCASMLQTWEYNSRMWQGVTSRGIFNLKKANNRTIEDFRMRMAQWMKGVENTQTIPAVNLDDNLEFIDLSRTLADMQFQQWWGVLIRLLCAFYCISPDEISLEMAPVGITSTLGTPSNRDKIIESRERGFAPDLEAYQADLNHYIIHKLDPHFSLEFSGLDAMTTEQREQFNAAKVQSIYTLNEVRAEEDLPKMDKENGDIILNPAWLQNRAMLQQAKMQQAQMAAQAQPYEEQGQPVDQAVEDESVSATDRDEDPGAIEQPGDEKETLQRSYRWTLEA